jgi:hypothetical protein
VDWQSAGDPALARALEESIVRYLDIEVHDASEIAEKIDI